MTTPGMPNDPGNPDETDEQNLSPNEAEAEAAAAAEAQGVDEDDDVYTTQPDPTVDGEIDPTMEATLSAEVDEALSDIEAELADQESAPSVEAELAERTEDLQRVSAEYANYRRRTERDREGLVLSAKASVLTSLLPVLDDLELAQQHGDLEEGSPLRAFADKLRDTLKSQKLEPFGEEGEAFDPEIHEAVQDLSSGEEKALGTVLRKGYRVGDRLVRTAMVIIADRDADAAASE
ncbi:nucleotide exchange factor GrpE [Corynebacterium guangdongense]|uniref:Protein GrpE n=1 Tax=Corynebacterium guangdongense TaxID=1783348 RepID=A0ABU1ZZX1_9CORY|nr:nucleotide exchange factor GrpE [Corynebacterium guangdongense]MDR7330385.1 molecular chaperone GrpE [Corynebacterium guangdongense]WJZ18943.1 heat shock protein GrpE [Corynebacterium guangdongense]